VITPEFSDEFQNERISTWRLVKPHANYCVDILTARWLLPAFAESYRLRRVTLWKELVAVHVWNAPHQWHNWWTAPPPLAKLNVKTGPLRSLHFGIYYSFGFSRLLFFAFLGVFSGDFGLMHSCSIPGLLLFFNYFLSVSQWAPFT